MHIWIASSPQQSIVASPDHEFLRQSAASVPSCKVVYRACFTSSRSPPGGSNIHCLATAPPHWLRNTLSRS
eukprot:scaffold40538_cov41-Prasinocladus_malaysianus.AAC.3